MARKRRTCTPYSKLKIEQHKPKKKPCDELAVLVSHTCTQYSFLAFPQGHFSELAFQMQLFYMFCN